MYVWAASHRAYETINNVGEPDGRLIIDVHTLNTYLKA